MCLIAFLTLYTRLAITIANILTTILLCPITSQTHKNILYDETITDNKLKQHLTISQLQKPQLPPYIL